MPIIKRRLAGPLGNYHNLPDITSAVKAINNNSQTLDIRPGPGERWVLIFARVNIESETALAAGTKTNLQVRLVNGSTTTYLKYTIMLGSDKANFFKYFVEFQSGVDGPIILTNTQYLTLFASNDEAIATNIHFTAVTVKQP